MNIDGHEVERREGGRVHIDDAAIGWNTYTPGFHAERALHYEDLAAQCRVVAEFVRREQAEKAERDAARELDRRANVARLAWIGSSGEHVPAWERISDGYKGTWRNIVRALDADAAERAT